VGVVTVEDVTSMVKGSSSMMDIYVEVVLTRELVLGSEGAEIS
jgi:hypothetical protein